MADPAVVRSVGIKQRALQRNLKDLRFCNQDVLKEQTRLETFRRDDPEKVDQQLKVVAEAEMMVPEYKNRIKRSADELRSLLCEDTTKALEGTEGLALAQQALADADSVANASS